MSAGSLGWPSITSRDPVVRPAGSTPEGVRDEDPPALPSGSDRQAARGTTSLSAGWLPIWPTTLLSLRRRRRRRPAAEAAERAARAPGSAGRRPAGLTTGAARGGALDGDGLGAAAAEAGGHRRLADEREGARAAHSCRARADQLGAVGRDDRVAGRDVRGAVLGGGPVDLVAGDRAGQGVGVVVGHARDHAGGEILGRERVGVREVADARRGRSPTRCPGCRRACRRRPARRSAGRRTGPRAGPAPAAQRADDERDQQRAAFRRPLLRPECRAPASAGI